LLPTQHLHYTTLDTRYILPHPKPALHHNDEIPRCYHGPRLFYRVEDEHSRARYIDREGITAEDTDTSVDFRKKGTPLFHEIAQHLDWSNRHPTPFISTYCDKDVAWREAERRVDAGKRNVRIYRIDMSASDERTEYRNIRLLAKNLGFYIPSDTWNNSMHEHIFLNYIPDSAVVGWNDL
jgi:hypothetical protein